MARNFIISFLAGVFVAGVSGVVLADNSSKANPLRDGSVLTGIDGKLICTDSNDSRPDQSVRNGAGDKWFFEFESDVADDRGQICAGTIVELLPSATLEKMIADVNERSDADYKLWGSITKYKGKNFIFPVYFLPITKVNDPNREKLKGSGQSGLQETKSLVNEPNDAFAIPDDIMAKLETREIVRFEQLGEASELKEDFVLADRTARLIKQPDGRPVFTLDALGRNVDQVSFQLLPCQILEWTQQKQSLETESLRFKIAGIVTKYKGQNYLLLQRATRIYSHGNFGN